MGLFVLCTAQLALFHLVSTMTSYRTATRPAATLALLMTHGRNTACSTKFARPASLSAVSINLLGVTACCSARHRHSLYFHERDSGAFLSEEQTEG